MNDEELLHYGVKGMKWGVRRYQNEDGTLTALGKKKAQLDDAKDRYSRTNSRKSRIALEYARNEFRDQKILDKIAKQKNKSKRQQNLENHYKEQGFSDKDAAIQAYKRNRTEKLLLIAGGMAVTALAAYSAYNHYDSITDKFIERGQTLGRISANNEEGVKDAFYAFANRHDANRYRALYGNDTYGRVGRVFEKTIGVNGRLKIASRDSAKRAMGDLFRKDPEYVNDVRRLMETWGTRTGSPKLRQVNSRALQDLIEGRGVTNDVYDTVNALLVIHDETGNRASGKFYDKLRSLGYAAIKDVNDSRYSGYGAHNPLIVFDTSKIKVDSVKEIGAEKIRTYLRSEVPKMVAEQTPQFTMDYISPAFPILAIPAGILASDRANMNRYIRTYYREHPNSKMSRNDLIRQYRNKNK